MESSGIVVAIVIVVVAIVIVGVAIVIVVVVAIVVVVVAVAVVIAAVVVVVTMHAYLVQSRTVSYECGRDQRLDLTEYLDLFRKLPLPL